MTATTWRWPPIALGAGACFGDILDGKRIGGHGQGPGVSVTMVESAERARRLSQLTSRLPRDFRLARAYTRVLMNLSFPIRDRPHGVGQFVEVRRSQRVCSLPRRGPARNSPRSLEGNRHGPPISWPGRRSARAKFRSARPATMARRMCHSRCFSRRPISSSCTCRIAGAARRLPPSSVNRWTSPRRRLVRSRRMSRAARPGSRFFASPIKWHFQGFQLSGNMLALGSKSGGAA